MASNAVTGALAASLVLVLALALGSLHPATAHGMIDGGYQRLYVQAWNVGEVCLALGWWWECCV